MKHEPEHLELHVSIDVTKRPDLQACQVDIETLRMEGTDHALHHLLEVLCVEVPDFEERLLHFAEQRKEEKNDERLQAGSKTIN